MRSLTAVAVSGGALLAGFAVAVAGTNAVAVPVAVTVWLLIAGHVAGRFRVSLVFASGYVLLLVGVATVTWNAIEIGGGVKIADPFLFAAVAIFALVALYEQWSPTVPWWFGGGVVVLMFGGLLSAMFSDNLSANVGVLLRFIAALALTTLVIGWGGQFRLLPIGVAWVSGISVSASVAVADAYLHTGIGPSVLGEEFFQRQAGLTAHPNACALTCALAAPFALRAVRWRKLVGIPLLAVLAVAVNASGSRAGIIALAVGVVVMAAALGHGKLTLAAVMVAAVAMIAYNAPNDDPRPSTSALARLVNSNTTATSDAKRAELRHNALESIQSDPLTGEGLSLVRTAHNLYLQLLQAGGVFLLLGFLIFVAGAAHLAHRNRRDLHAAAAGASLLAWLAAGAFQNHVYDRYLYVPAGILFAVWMQQRPALSHPRRLRP